MKALERQDYFPTMVFQGEVDGPERLNTDMIAAIYAARDQAEPSDAAASDYSQNWRSARKLHRQAEFADLHDQIQSALDTISADLRYAQEYQLKVTAMWANIIASGNAKKAECRPGNLWAGCYCVQVPKGMGSLKFIDPRTIHVMNPPRYEKNNRPRAALTKVEVKPTPGRFVLFPAWLYHEVEPNLAEEAGQAGDFIYLSFNVAQRKK